MALILKDRVKETTAVTGTGTATLLGAATGFQSFSVIGNANTTYYCIANSNEWEVGIGTYTSSGTTLARTTVLSSSNGGSLVNFSAGTKDVFVTYPSGKSVNYEQNGGIVISESGSVAALRITNTGTGNSLLVEDSANPDSTPFVIDSLGQVGVGTTAPSVASGSGVAIYSSSVARLALRNSTTGDASTDGSGLFISGTDFGLENREGGNIIFYSPSERMRLDASGNLGLGVTPSAWATVKVLQINNCSLYGYSTAETGMTGNAYYNAGWKYIATGTATKYTQGEVANGVHAWYNAPSGTAGAAITFTQAMTLNASGNLGIGNIPSGAYKLEVSGKAAATTQVSTNGITVNSQTMTTSQTIAAGTSGFTVGPFTMAPGAVLTIESGARHVII